MQLEIYRITMKQNEHSAAAKQTRDEKHNVPFHMSLKDNLFLSSMPHHELVIHEFSKSFNN